MKKYTLGFIFTPALDKVLLVHKISPEWQAGKINGVGGKIEEGELILFVRYPKTAYQKETMRLLMSSFEKILLSFLDLYHEKIN